MPRRGCLAWGLDELTKPVIVFVGAVYPGQFGRLCDYLRETGMAEAYFLTTPGHMERNRERGPHILGFKPDGKIVGDQSYYYTSKVERSARISRGVLSALTAFQKQRKIDVVVAHSLWGAPHFLYDEIDAAIVSYIEFPSFRAHGWDPAYPPDQSQRMTDRNTEMLNFHQALCSDLVICPSRHARGGTRHPGPPVHNRVCRARSVLGQRVRDVHAHH